MRAGGLAGAFTAMPYVGTAPIIARGDKYIKWADGTMAQFDSFNVSMTAGNPNNAIQITFPIAFIAINIVDVMPGWPSNTWDQYGLTGIQVSTTSFTANFKNGAVAQSLNNCRYIAWGTWK